GQHVAILADLCGPKIRVGHFEDGAIELKEGDEVTVTVRDIMGKPGLIPSEYKALADDVKAGDRLLLDDGRRELRVVEVEGTEIHCTVVRGGRLSNRKGINLPGVDISAPSLTEKDRADAAFAAELGVDFMALSFVRHQTDVYALRQLLTAQGRPHIPLISKIEKPEALDHIEGILEASDAIMVARGDMGVEMAAEEVPLIQRELTRLAIERNTAVIVATQMLESMIRNPTPTRAEVTDVAWAAMAGADAVMLSGETAAGDHPVEAVQTMDRVLRLIEGHQFHQDQFDSLVEHDTAATDEATIDMQLSEALARGTAQLSRELSARAIAICSHTGHTAHMISAERPAAPILALTSNPATARRLAVYWGVRADLATPEEMDNPIQPTLERVRHFEMIDANSHQFVLLVTGGRNEQERLSPGITILMS
ncbi:MAG: pyruvate kinase, partial [Myxococcota bacterium]